MVNEALYSQIIQPQQNKHPLVAGKLAMDQELECSLGSGPDFIAEGTSWPLIGQLQAEELSKLAVEEMSTECTISVPQ